MTLFRSTSSRKQQHSVPKPLQCFFLLLWITSSSDAMPDPELKNELASSKNYVGIATQVITNAMFNIQSETPSNLIFSPLGYATILSILGQGSVGETRDEIYKVLEQPTNEAEILSAYHNTLKAYAGKDPMIAPQFKTWFYVYKNVSSDEKFRKILEDHYLVEVKDIERLNDFSNTDDNDEKPFEELTLDSLEELNIETTDSVLKAIQDYDQLNQDEKNQVSKFDKHVDDEQYIDSSVIKKDVPRSDDGPEKLTLNTRKYLEDSAEIMIAQENFKFESRFGRARPLHLEGDVTSALTGNAIIGRRSGKNDDQETKMLLFNGLYFRGEWEQPFTPIKEKMAFHGSNKEQMTGFMCADGNFKYADVRSKQLTAVEFPYKNEKYSLMIVMPDTYKDLKYLSKHLDADSFNEISAQLEASDLRVIVPKFRVEFTSKADKALGQLGLKSIFTKNSDLRGMSNEAEGFHIDELVQHVAIKVDEAYGSTNSLSATTIEGQARNNVKSQKIVINRPFIFYIRDLENDVILTAGKIVEIIEDEIPITFNV